MVSKVEADRKADQVDYLLMRLGQGLVQLPIGQGIISFFQCDGKPPERPEDASVRRGELTLGTLRDKYLKVHRGSLEDTTFVSTTIHAKHLVRTLGEGFAIGRLTLADLQRHADRRREIKFRGRKIGPATIREELVSLRTVWNWVVAMA